MEVGSSLVQTCFTMSTQLSSFAMKITIHLLFALASSAASLSLHESRQTSCQPLGGALSIPLLFNCGHESNMEGACVHLANDEQNIALLIPATSLKTVAVRNSAVSNAEIHVSVFWDHSNVMIRLLLMTNVL